MALHLHRAPRTDLLADRLAALVAEPLDDPFAEELVVVPATGVERWLTQRLSHRLGVGPRGGDGVCAGVRFVSPRSLVALLTGTEREDPWDPDRLVWPLLRTVDAALGEPWCAPLARHLGAGSDVPEEQRDLRRDRRWSVARRLAALYASYAGQRPALLADWRAGRDTDGVDRPLPDDLRWQAELWRRLLAAVPHPAPDERHERAVAAIRAGEPLALPDRLSLFGHTRMPVTELALLRAVAEVREVHLWLPQPSPAAWEALAAVVADGPVRRLEDTTGRAVRHPLLAALGRDSRELQRSLALLGPVADDLVTDDPATGSPAPGSPTADGPAPGGPATDRPRAGPPTLLRLLQDDLRADRAPAAREGRRLAEGDRSVQVHACHGSTRQVEVLREVLTALLEDDPTLEPRDVLVMCPDVEAFAPLFSAAFGLGEAQAHPAHQLRVRLADRGLLGTNPLVATAALLVELAGGRARASEVLDLASSAPVRHRFGFADDDISTLTRWVEQSGVRWGLTGNLRDLFGLADVPQNSWQVGVDRVLLGAAMTEVGGRHLGGTLPLDDVGSSSVDLAGRLAELVARLEGAVTRLRAATTVDSWLAALGDGVAAVASVPPQDEWQRSQLDRELDAVREAAAGTDTPLRLADVRTLLDQRTRPRPTRANFRTGNLTVATLVPMRSVPHRVVCLVGLDDGVFPRTTTADGDDVLARGAMTGERDPRSEDRQLLLDAVLAAEEALVVTYTGANEHSGQERPPAVPLGELLDALERTVPGARDQVVVRHPLQPFDPRNFTDPAFSFDTAAHAGAQAALGDRRPRGPLVAGPLPARPPEDVALADLTAFLLHPVRGFLRQRLDVGLPQEYDEVEDALPVEVDALTAWKVGDRILRAVIDGADPQGVLVAEQLRGDLPPLRLGERTLREITGRAGQLYARTAGLREQDPRSLDVTVDLGGGRRLTGVVGDVRGGSIVRVHYSTLSPRHRLESWVDLLALSAGMPDVSWTARTIGWHRTGPRLSLLGPVDHTAVDLLRDLVDLADRGRCEPLPLPLRTGYAWADAVRARKDPSRSARDEWQSQDNSPVPGEQDDAAHVRVLGRSAPFAVLLQEPRPDETWNAESHRLGRLARRLWDPLFAHEVVDP